MQKKPSRYQEFGRSLKTAILLIPVCIVTLFAQSSWLPFAQGQSIQAVAAGALDNLPRPAMTISDSGSLGVEIDYKFPGGLLLEKEENGENFQLLRIDEFNTLNNPGKPALPARSFTVMVPDGMSPVIKIIDNETMSYSGYRILPARKLAPDKVGAPEPAFEIDNQTYNSSELYPSSAVSITGISKYRGKKLAKIQISPVQYNPARGILNVYSRIHFKVEFEKNNETAVQTNPLSPYHAEILSGIAGNPKVFTKDMKLDASATSLSQLRGGYLIITIPAYAAAADTLAKWKRQMGYTVSVISQTGWTTAMIRDSIHNRYLTAASLEFCAIIGDHPDVPSLSSSLDATHVTDLYYACMDGSSDFTPDIGIGRLSVSSANEALIVVKKSVDYERNPITDPQYYSTALAAAYFQHASNGYAERRFAQTSWEIEQYLKNHQGYSVDREFYTESTVSPTHWNNGYYSSGELIPTELQRPNYAWDGDAAGISASINSGRFLVSHRDHGDVGLWGDPYYTSSNVSSLTNGNKLPVVLSINCLTGKFDYSTPCFSEVFLRHPTGGAVGVVCATEVSYSGQNDAMAEGIIDAIWPNPGLVPIFPHNTNPSVTPHEPIYQMGLALNQGKIRMSQTWNNGTAPFNYETYSYELFHFLGDPSLQIWTALPAAVSITSPSVLMIGQTTYTISAATCADGVATLSFEGNIIGKCNLTNGAGVITLTSLPMTTGKAVLTITAHNFRPLQREIDVIPPGDAIFASTPAAGTVFDIGETINVTWQTFGSIPNVRIEFSSNNGSTFTVLASSMANVNAYSFTAPSVEADSCIVRISSAVSTPAGSTAKFAIHNVSTISGTVAGNVISKVWYSGPMAGNVLTSTSGAYSIVRLLPGDYTLYAQNGSYLSSTQIVTVPSDKIVNFTINYPNIALSPNILNVNLMAGGVDTVDIVVTNSGNAALNYTVGGADVNQVSAMEQYDQSHFVEIPHGMPDTRTGKSVTDNSGGPDIFGYTWSDSDDPDGPQFVWNDISTTGTVVSGATGCGDCYGQVSLSWPVKFYGNEYSTAWVTTKGFISLSSGTYAYTNYSLPSTSAPAAVLCAFWDDLSTASNGAVYFQQTAGAVTFQWNNIHFYGSSGNMFTFQIVISKQGTIHYYYNQMSGSTTGATVGIQNTARNDGFTIAYNTAYLKNSFAIRIAENPKWLKLAKNSGIVQPHSSDTVGVIFNASEMDIGEYADSLTFSHNSPSAASSLFVPCILNVTSTRLRFSGITSAGNSVSNTNVSENFIMKKTVIGSVSSGIARGSQYTVILE